MAAHLPGGVESACITLEEQGAMPHLVEETRKMYADPDRMFREVWHGSGKQLIPNFTEEARVEYIQLVDVLIDRHQYMEDIDLHFTVISLGSVGVLGSKHLAEIVGLPKKVVHNALYKPQTEWEPRLGGDFNRAGLKHIKASLMRVISGQDPDFDELLEAKEAGISIVLLSRLAGIPAQTLTKRFRTIMKRRKETPVDHPGDGVQADTHLEGHSISSGEGVPVTADESPAEAEPEPWPRNLADADLLALVEEIDVTDEERKPERKAALREYARRRRARVGNGVASREASSG